MQINTTFDEIVAECKELQICACCCTATEMTSSSFLCLDCEAEAEQSRWDLDQAKESIFRS